MIARQPVTYVTCNVKAFVNFTFASLWFYETKKVKSTKRQIERQLESSSVISVSLTCACQAWHTLHFFEVLWLECGVKNSDRHIPNNINILLLNWIFMFPDISSFKSYYCLTVSLEAVLCHGLCFYVVTFQSYETLGRLMSI